MIWVHPASRSLGLKLVWWPRDGGVERRGCSSPHASATEAAPRTPAPVPWALAQSGHDSPGPPAGLELGSAGSVAPPQL